MGKYRNNFLNFNAREFGINHLRKPWENPSNNYFPTIEGLGMFGYIESAFAILLTFYICTNIPQYKLGQ